MRCVGTVVRGIRTPIIKENDDLASIVVNSLIDAKKVKILNFEIMILLQLLRQLLGFLRVIMLLLMMLQKICKINFLLKILVL